MAVKGHAGQGTQVVGFLSTELLVSDRDLGEYIRKRVTEAFKHGEASAVNEEDCYRIYSSLNRIASGTYAAK